MTLVHHFGAMHVEFWAIGFQWAGNYFALAVIFTL